MMGIKLRPLESDRRLVILGGLFWLAAISAPLVESDAYRYVTVALIVGMFLTRPPELDDLKHDWLSWLCMGWGVYAIGRFVATYLLTPAHDAGSSELLYAFPLLFPLLGLALWLYRAHIERVLAVFFVIALALLLVTTQYATVLSGDRASPLVHNNPIHGAVGAGMVMIGAFYWFMYYLEKGFWQTRLSRLAATTAPVIFALCLFNIYGAKSKGVWLALSFALPFLCFSLPFYINRKIGLTLAGAIGALVALAAYMVRGNLWQTAGPTITASSGMVNHDLAGTELRALLSQTIASPDTPISMMERLKLWSNALEVFSAAPVLGSGNSWLRLWHETRYGDIGYDLLHNGYFEIVIRHGLLGLGVLAVILGAFIHRVYRAYAERLISKSAFLCYVATIGYLMVTLLSNSNNRLAIGESFFLMIGAVAFYCSESLLHDGRRIKS